MFYIVSKLFWDLLWINTVYSIKAAYFDDIKFLCLSLSLQLNTNVNNIRCWPHPIPELDLKTHVSTEDKIQKGVCGFSFISEALGLIYDHQRDMHGISNKIFHKINTMKQELSRSEKCLKEQCRKNTKPLFNRDDTFSRLQWGRTIIESSIVFMEQLVDIVEPRHKKNLTSGSDLKHPPHSHSCTIHKCDN